MAFPSFFCTACNYYAFKNAVEADSIGGIIVPEEYWKHNKIDWKNKIVCIDSHDRLDRFFLQHRLSKTIVIQMKAGHCKSFTLHELIKQ